MAEAIFNISSDPAGSFEMLLIRKKTKRTVSADTIMGIYNIRNFEFLNFEFRIKTKFGTLSQKS